MRGQWASSRFTLRLRADLWRLAWQCVLCRSLRDVSEGRCAEHSPGGLRAPGSALRSPWRALRSGRILPVLRRVWTVTEDNHRALRGFRVPGASDLIEHTSWGGVCVLGFVCVHACL